MSAAEAGPGGLLGPLRAPAFRAMWLGNQVIHLGTFMQAVAVAWVITSLTTDPAIVALVPMAGTIPSLLVSLPSGVVGDVVGRRRVLGFCYVWMAIFAVLLAVAVLSGKITPPILLGLLFLIGMGNSARIPAWQATVQDVVPPGMVASAVALNTMGFNTCRSFGPALGGILVALVGPGWVIVANALGPLAGLAAVKQLRHPPPRERPTKEELIGALGEGWRYLLQSGRLLRLVLRLATFNGLFACVWGFLPLIGRDRLGLQAWEYGLLLTLWGAGAILGAAMIPRMRNLFAVRRLLFASSMLAALGVAALALAADFPSALAAAFLGGASNAGFNINLNVTFQQQAPPETRCRLLSFYFLVFQVSMGFGAGISGWVASWLGVPAVMLICALLLALATGWWSLVAPPAGRLAGSQGAEGERKRSAA